MYMPIAYKHVKRPIIGSLTCNNVTMKCIYVFIYCRLKCILKHFEKGTAVQDDIIKNLTYAATVLDAVCADGGRY